MGEGNRLKDEVFGAARSVEMPSFDLIGEFKKLSEAAGMELYSYTILRFVLHFSQLLQLASSYQEFLQFVVSGIFGYAQGRPPIGVLSNGRVLLKRMVQTRAYHKYIRHASQALQQREEHRDPRPKRPWPCHRAVPLQPIVQRVSPGNRDALG